MKLLLRLALLALLPLLSACENEAYDTGDGALSAMRADFVVAETDADARMTGFETDGGERLRLASPVAVGWMDRPDTVYRALLYYNKVTAADGSAAAEPLSMTQPKKDPVTFVCSWTSANGRYLNLELLVKTGKTDDGYGTQSVGMVCDSVTVDAAGRRIVWLSLTHDQSGVPEYYSTEAYVSVPVSALPVSPVEGDEVRIGVILHNAGSRLRESSCGGSFFVGLTLQIFKKHPFAR